MALKLFMTSYIEPFVVIDYDYFLNISIRISGICCSVSTVPREGFDSSVIILFSWCVVAVTLPI